MTEKLEGPDGMIELTVALEAQINLGMVTDFDSEKLDREKWAWKYGYKPFREVMSDGEFFGYLDLSIEELSGVAEAVSAGALERARSAFLKAGLGRTRSPAWQLQEPVPPDPEVLLARVAPYMAGEPFQLTRKAFPSDFAMAYEATGEVAYLEKWLEIFDSWYHTMRPPAGVPTVYISCHFMENPWETLITGNTRIKQLAQVENYLRGCPGDTGTPTQRLNLHKSLIEHGQFLASMNQAFHPNNWQVHQLTGLLEVSLQFPEYRESASWCELCLKWLGEHIRRETLPDGTHHERCTAYNSGVMQNYRQTLELVRRAGLAPPDGFVETLEKMYRQSVYLYAPGLAQIGIGDGGTTGPDRGLDLMIDGALSFHLPECKWFTLRHPEKVRAAAARLYDDGAEEALLRYEQLEARRPAATSVVFPDAGWAVMRSSWEDEALYMITDFGSNASWHTHADLMGFSVVGNGRPLITDAGTGGTLGYQSDVSKKWYKQTIGHNTVLVDGLSQERFHQGTCHRWIASGGFDYLHASHPAYAFLGIEHGRRILFVKAEYWIVTDALRVAEFVTTSGYHEYQWLAHFQPATLETAEGSAVWGRTAFDAHIGVLPMRPEQVELRLETGPISTPEGEVADAPVLKLCQEGEPPVDFGVVLVPFRGQKHPQVSVANVETEEGDVACRIQFGDGATDLYFENHSGVRQHRFADLLFDGELGWIRQHPVQGSRWFLVNACQLARDGTLLFCSDRRVEWVEVCERDGVLEIGVDAPRRMTIWSPEADEVRVNGRRTAFVRSGRYVVVDAP